MIGRQLKGARTQEQRGNQDRAGEISKVARGPQQRRLFPACPSFPGRYRQVHVVAGEQLGIREDNNRQADSEESSCDHFSQRDVVEVLHQHPKHEDNDGQAHPCAHRPQQIARRASCSKLTLRAPAWAAFSTYVRSGIVSSDRIRNGEQDRRRRAGDHHIRIAANQARDRSAFKRPTRVGVVLDTLTGRHGSPRVPARAPHTSTPSSLRRCPSRSEPAPCTRREISAMMFAGAHRSEMPGTTSKAARRVDPGRPRASSATSRRCTCRNNKDQDCCCAGLRLRAPGIASSRCQHLPEHESRRSRTRSCLMHARLPRQGCGVRMRRDALTGKQDNALGTFGGKPGKCTSVGPGQPLASSDPPCGLTAFSGGEHRLLKCAALMASTVCERLVLLMSTRSSTKKASADYHSDPLRAETNWVRRARQRCRRCQPNPTEIVSDGAYWRSTVTVGGR